MVCVVFCVTTLFESPTNTIHCFCCIVKQYVLNIFEEYMAIVSWWSIYVDDNELNVVFMDTNEGDFYLFVCKFLHV